MYRHKSDLKGSLFPETKHSHSSYHTSGLWVLNSGEPPEAGWWVHYEYVGASATIYLGETLKNTTICRVHLPVNHH